MDLQVIAIVKDIYNNKILRYRVIDKKNFSIEHLTSKELQNIGMEIPKESTYPIVDMNNELRPPIMDTIMYTVLDKVADKRQYIISDYNGQVETVYQRKLYYISRKFGVSNIEHKDDRNPDVIIKLNQSISVKDEEFIADINRKYTEFVSKCRIFGKDIQFKYEVDGHDVIINKYTGKSNDIVLPNFVTIIAASAFSAAGQNKQIETVKLNDGLKEINTGAFFLNKISEVVIPETVEIVGEMAFSRNKITFSQGPMQSNRLLLDLNKFKVLNENTIIENQTGIESYK